MTHLRILALLLGAQALWGQSETATRAGEIEAERQAKAANIQPVAENEMVRKANALFGRVLGMWIGSQNGLHGVSLKMGGLAVGSGIALGPEYVFRRGDFEHPKLLWDSYAVGSPQGYYRLQSSLDLPRLFGDHAFAGATGVRFDYPRLAYYGPGPESRKTGGTNYRMENNSLEFRAGLQLFRKLRVGAIGGFQNVQISAGTDPRLPDTDAVYSIAQAHGLDRQATFLSGGFFLQYESRDEPGDPRKGSLLFAQFQNINGSRRALGGFNQYDFEVQHYFHYWNRRRIIATRVKSVLTTPHPNTFVPFYLEPRLGGSDDLRGFRPYRFYDQNSILATVEYRWTVLEPLDMAIFADAGKVYGNFDQLSLSRIRTDLGFGLRARAGRNVPLRVDVGFSREGVQVWINFYNVF